VQFVAVQIEVVLAAWLILGRWRVAAWMSACLMLTALAALSLTAALRGQSDCGCFGSLKVHPGITTAVNLVALGLLLLFRPTVKWAESRGTVLAVVSLAAVTGWLVWTANSPLGGRPY
jgi:hypothetical protein